METCNLVYIAINFVDHTTPSSKYTLLKNFEHTIQTIHCNIPFHCFSGFVNNHLQSGLEKRTCKKGDYGPLLLAP